jgi:hypothetical protein
MVEIRWRQHGTLTFCAGHFSPGRAKNDLHKEKLVALRPR